MTIIIMNMNIIIQNTTRFKFDDCNVCHSVAFSGIPQITDCLGPVWGWVGEKE